MTPAGPWDVIYNLSGITALLQAALGPLLPDWAVLVILAVVGILAVMAFLVPSQLATVWIERRLIARLQVRRGPNRAGRWGLLQPVADAVKVLAKEALTPAGADRWVFWMAPIVAYIPAMLTYAVLPFGPNMTFVDLHIGVLYLISVSSLTVIMVFMAGWSSNNKYSLLGAMRAVAQMISYEVPMALSVVGVLMLAGTMQTSQIVERQITSGVWYVLLQPLGFLIFFIAGLAELNRTPTDIMEAESEIVAGYHTEYSGMKFSLFYVAEYTHALAFCGIIATLFFGGWASAPVLDLIPPWIWFLAKLYFFFLVLVWIRATLPRLRIDQLMDFAWKFLIPLSLANILVTGVEIIVLDPQGTLTMGPTMAVLVAVNLALGVILLVGWARLLATPSRRPAPALRLQMEH